MRFFSIAFLIGNCILALLSSVPSLVFIQFTFFILLCAFGILLVDHKRSKTITACLFVFVALLSGFSLALFRANNTAGLHLDAALQNKSIVIRGSIASIPEQQQFNSAFEFDISSLVINHAIKPLLMRVRLNYLGPYPSPLKVGDVWQLQVRLKPPHGFSNPGSFDYERWLFEHRIRATGYVRVSSDNRLLESHWYQHPIDRVRQVLAERITTILQTKETKGFITALAVGVRSDITPTQWQVLRATGTNHLMAIAGLHIGLLAAMVSFLINYLWRRSNRLALLLPSQIAAAVFALLAAITYSAFAGFALPTQRAVIMLTVFLASVLFRRHLLPWQGLLIALCIILLLDPLATLSDSFWLSFAAVSAIIYGMSARLGAEKGWRELWQKWGRTQWLIAVGLLPTSLLFFHEVSLSGVLANTLAIPWVGFIVLPLTILGCIGLLIVPFLGVLLIKFANLLLSLFWPVLENIANISWLRWHAEIHNSWIMIASIIGIILLLAPRGMPARWMGMCWLLPLVLWQPPRPPANEVWFTLLDVGQGLSAVIQTQHHVLIYDTGERFSDDFDMGEAVVVPFLRNQGIHQIDKLIISHEHTDHSGGVHSVIRELPTLQVLSSVPALFARKHAAICLQGQSWQWDGVRFQILYPTSEWLGHVNDSCCVLRVSVGNKAILLPGDIEKKAERYLLEKQLPFLQANILVAPHHGSRTSSTQNFIHAVNPQYVLFGVGYYNRYHFPHPLIVSRYQENGTAAYDSVHNGAITFKLNAHTAIAKPDNYRQSHHRFWNE